MNIQQIEYIIAVGELKSFGQAAEKCFITQSTLSTMIAKFEGEIGIKIFDRKTKPVTVTKEGKTIIQQLKVIAKELDNLQEITNTLKGEISGTLKIGVIPTVAPYLLPLFLNKFIRKLPNVHFIISEMTTEKIVEKVEKRELDIGIVSIPLNNSNLKETLLYHEPFLLFDKVEGMIEHHFMVDDIDFDRLWLLEEGHCMRTQIESICNLRSKRTINRNLDYKSGTIDTLLKFVNRNNGVTLLPYLATLDFPESERSYLKEFSSPVPVRSIGLVVHRHFVKKGILKLLKKEIQTQIEPLITIEAEQKIIAPL